MSGEAFRLDPLIKIRESERNSAREELRKAESAVREARARLEELDRDLESNLSEWNRTANGATLAVGALVRLRARREHLQKEREQASATLAEFQAEVDRRCAAFGETVKEVRILENLKERKLGEKSESDQRAEQKTQDALSQGAQKEDRDRDGEGKK